MDYSEINKLVKESVLIVRLMLIHRRWKNLSQIQAQMHWCQYRYGKNIEFGVIVLVCRKSFWRKSNLIK